jgi:hypothetical protein
MPAPHRLAAASRRDRNPEPSWLPPPGKLPSLPAEGLPGGRSSIASRWVSSMLALVASSWAARWAVGKAFLFIMIGCSLLAS